MADSQQRNSNPDKPLDSSSTGKQCLENTTGEQCDSSLNKLEAASSTDIEKPAINATAPQTPTHGRHRLPIIETSKHNLSPRIQPRLSKQTLFPSARAESQVNIDQAEKASSLQISGSAIGSPSKKNASPQVKSQEEESGSQTTGSAASLPSTINSSPQTKPRVNTDQAQKGAAGSPYKGHSPQVESQEEESSSQITGSAASSPSTINSSPQTKPRGNTDPSQKGAAGSPYKGNSPQVKFKVNIDHAEEASSSKAPESAARSLFLEKSPRSFRFNKKQREILIKAYQQNTKPCYSTKIKLASELNVEYIQVHTWFYRRSKAATKKASKPVAATPKSPRKWTQCNQRELDLLVVAFQKNAYPSQKVQNEMSKKINLSTHEIVQWFKHRRKIEKKKKKQSPSELTEEESDQD